MRAIVLFCFLCLGCVVQAQEASELVSYSEGSKWGFKDKNNKVVITAKYEWVRDFSEGLAGVKANGKWGFVDKTGKEVVSVKYDWVDDFRSNFALVKLNNKLGLIDKSGKVIAEPKYDAIYGFIKGLAKVNVGGVKEGYDIIGGKWGFIDKAGNEIVTPKYEWIENFKKRIAFANVGGTWDKEKKKITGGKWGAIDRAGNEIIAPKYDKLELPQSGLIQATLNQKIIYIDASGKENLTPKYTWVDEFTEEGLAKINIGGIWNKQTKKVENGKWGFIDRTGREIVAPKYDAVKDFIQDFAEVQVNNQKGIVNKKGIEIISPRYDEIGIYQQGFRIKINDKYGFLDITGKEILSPKYDILFYYPNENVFWINLGGLESGKWAIADYFAKILQNPKYEYITDFSEGFAGIKLKGKWGFVDRQAKEILAPTYDAFVPFSGGRAGVNIGGKQNNFGGIEGGKWGFVDRTGKVVVSPKYDWIEDFSEDLAAVQLSGKWGFIDKEGKEIVIPRFEEVKSFKNGFATVKLNNKWGFINKTGKQITPCQYKEIGWQGTQEGFILALANNRWVYVDSTGKEYAPNLTNMLSAELSFRKFEKNFEKKILEYVYATKNLAMAYAEQEKYTEAEELIKKTSSNLKKHWSRENLDNAQLYLTLALIHIKGGRYWEAENLFKKIAEITRDFPGNEAEGIYLQSVLNLGKLYYQQGLYVRTDSLNNLAKNKLLGKDWVFAYIQNCMNLAELYHTTGLYQKAALWGEEALENIFNPSENFEIVSVSSGDLSANNETSINLLGKGSPLYAQACNLLAEIYIKQRRYAEAEALLKEAQNIQKNIFDKDHKDCIKTYSNLAKLFQKQGKYQESETLYKQSSSSLINNIRRNFVAMSEKQKEEYLATIKDNFDSYFSFVLESKRYELSSWLLENIMFSKGLLFFSSNQLAKSAEQSKDSTLRVIYQEWLSKRKELSRAYELSKTQQEEQKISLDTLIIEADDLERKLSKRLTALSIKAELSPRSYKWEELLKKLNEQEVLVEMLRIRYNNTDSLVYVALVLRKGYKQPAVVVFPNGREMETGDISFYRNSIQLRKEDKLSFDVFFSPLMQHLSGAKKLYFSGDGVYHQLNLQTLYLPKEKKFLDELLDIQIIGTSRDIFSLDKDSKRSLDETYRLYLFGNPDFSGSSRKIASVDTMRVLDFLSNKISKSKQRFIDILSGRVSPLPGTQKEVEAISGFAQSRGLKVQTYMGSEASEENLKLLSSPAVLHIATHGFFVPSASDSLGRNVLDNPLLRSGLLLAGSELSLQQKGTGSEENGILTAQEAMNLNLRGTDLVVLSACETGLGEIKSGEGVYGLQRSFQGAGARSVLMSLWKVDDSATQEMMSMFYENMLLRKQSKRVAFSNAQQSLRKKYPQPYYWGAFVLVGE